MGSRDWPTASGPPVQHPLCLRSSQPQATLGQSVKSRPKATCDAGLDHVGGRFPPVKWAVAGAYQPKYLQAQMVVVVATGC